jgi:hypothetical protein
MTAQSFKISSLEDLGRVAALGGLPVGPRTGPSKRTQAKKELYVIIKFLREAIPAGIFEPPIAIRAGCQFNDEPDFVVTRGGSADVLGLVEITEATNEPDQREMTLSEYSGKPTILGQFGGRFSGGASRSGLVWASDVVEAIKRKRGKVIFRNSPAARHLIVYPNSNASILLFKDLDEVEAIGNLREAIAKEAASLAQTTNGCLVHILGKYHVCVDVLGNMTLLPMDQMRLKEEASGR